MVKVSAISASRRKDRGYRRGVWRGCGNRRLPRPAYPSRRHRHPGAFSRAWGYPQGRLGIGIAQRRDGRGHRRIRDAEYRSAHHQRRKLWPTKSNARAVACIAISPFTSAAHAKTSRTCPSWKNCPAARGRVFMGSSTGTLLVDDDGGVRDILQAIRRRACSSEDEYRLRERQGCGLKAMPAHIRYGATRWRRSRAHSDWCGWRMRPASAFTCRMSPPRRRWNFLPATRTSHRSRQPASSHPGGA